MNKRFALVLILFVLLPAAAFAETTARYIVVTRQPAPQALTRLRGDDFEPGVSRRVRTFRSVNGFAADLTPAEVEELKASRHVQWVEPVVEWRLLAVDTVTPGQQTTPFGVNMVHAPDVWSVTKGVALDGPRTPIRVAVIDTGIRHTIDELKGAYKGGHNFIDGSANPYDDHGHGTHVAGTIAAADNGAGVIGVAPQIELYGLKVLDQCGSGTNEAIILALDWILAKKAAIGGNWIVNLSLGGPSSSAAGRIAFQRAADAGILVFAASGNGYDEDPVDGLSYPAAYPTVISVGAVDSAGTVASFSQRGPDLKLVAPGVEVLSTYVSGSVDANDGRQFAAFDMEADDSEGDTLCLPRSTVTAPFLFAGRGNPADFPSGVSGKIVLMERGDLTFAEKAKNAKLAGAVGLIIYNNVPGAFSGTLGELISTDVVPYTVSMSREDGLALRATPNVSLTFAYGREGFALQQGTSMASPHAAGVAALVWAVAPAASASAVRDAMIDTARDLGPTGVDNTYGYGLVNALDAAKKLNAFAFSNPVTPAPSLPVTGRQPGRRGH